MTSCLEKIIMEEISNWQKLAHKHIANTIICNANSIDADTRRLIIIGCLISDYFPCVRRFEPQETEAENFIEFAPLRRVLEVLLADKYIDSMTEESPQGDV